MRRRQAVAAEVVGELPRHVAVFDPADWDAPEPSVEDRVAADDAAKTNEAVTVEQYHGVMARRRRRQAFDRAQREWCEQHGLTDHHGAINWRVFGPMVEAARGGRP